MTTGLDYSAGTIPGKTILDAGHSFVIRYTDDPNLGIRYKHILPQEYADLTGAGVRVYLVFEINVDDMLGGFVDGIANAMRARAGADWIGYPAGGLIFFACDQHLTAAQIPVAMDYIDAAIRILGNDSVGVYAFDEVINAAKASGRGSAYWQAGHQPATGSGVHIWQRNDGFIRVGGVECDLNELLIPLPTGDDDMTPEQEQKLDECHTVLTALMDAWGGGITNKENDGTPDPDREEYNLAEFMLRNNVEIHQATRMIEQQKADLAELRAQIAAAPAGTTTGKLTQADVNKIAASVLALLGSKLSQKP